MSRRDDLIALRDAVQAGKAFRLDDPQRKARTAEYPCLGGYYEDNMAYGAFHGSVDAALVFLTAVLPGWKLQALQQFESGTWYSKIYKPMTDWPKWTPFPEAEASAETPARALLLATLNALIAEADT